MPRSDNLGMVKTDTHPMPLNGLDQIGTCGTSTDEVFRPWAETMPAPEPAVDAPRSHRSRGRGFAFVAVAVVVSVAGLVVYALRKLFRR